MSMRHDYETLEAIAQELERRKYRDNLYLFNKDILGYDLMTIKPHLDLCNYAQYDNQS